MPVEHLSAAEIAQLFYYDEVTGFVHRRIARSRAFKAGDRAGCTRADGYRGIEVNGRNYFEHRVVWALVHGEWPDKHLDHRNGNRADNRIQNLRLAQVFENAQNRKLRSDNKSGHAGVYWNKQCGKWLAAIRTRGNQSYLGLFETREGAINAYRKAKAELHTFQPLPRD